MKKDLLKRYSEELETLSQQYLKRELAPISGIDFTSNDFLGFSHALEIREAVEEALDKGMPVGSGGSRLLRGNHDIHEQLEAKAAEFFGCDKALYFTSGYSANFAILTSLPKKQDLIVFDALSHASIREGIFTSQAKSVKVQHNDVNAVENALAKWRTGSSSTSFAWIVVESLYSMDGDRAALDDLFEVADRFGAALIVDEAHATGVFGKTGGGLTEPYQGRSNLVVLHTCGKALGAAGALVCASSNLIDFMISRCRPFIYSTAPSPIMATAVKAALKLLENSPQRRCMLHKLIEFANQELEHRFDMSGSGSQIIPFIIGDDSLTLQVAREMQDMGFDLRAIRPPTVPSGTSRLRISITLNVSEQEIREMFDTLYQVIQRVNAIPKPI